MTARSRIALAALAALAMLGSEAAPAAPYNPAQCALITGTLNIHWEAVGGPYAPCTSIEFTNGSFAQAATGALDMEGTSVSNPLCTYPTAYRIRRHGTDELTAVTQALYDGAPVVSMTLTRAPGEACFSGHWTFGGDDYVAQLWAAPFLVVDVPTLGIAGLMTLAAALGAVAAVSRRTTRARKPDA
jgi:hypothetical protein